MSVRNRISTFEAHNEEIRKSSTPLSPSVASPHSSASGAASSNNLSPRPPADAGGGGHQVSPYAIHDSPDRPASETIVASQMRTNRLQRQQSGSSADAAMDSRSKNLQTTRRLMGVPDAAAQRSATRPTATGPVPVPASGPPGVSLFAHRRPSENNAGDSRPDPSRNGASGQHAAGHYSGQASSLSRKATEHSRRRMLMQPRLNHDDAGQDTAATERAGFDGQRRQPQPSSPRRALASTRAVPDSAEPERTAGASTSARMGKMQRIKKMRNVDRQRSRDRLSNHDSASLNPSSSAEANGNDDDITLTSVRQIVGSASPPPTGQFEDRGGSFRSASSPSTVDSAARKNAPDDENSQHLVARSDSLEDDGKNRGKADGNGPPQWTQGEEKSDKAQGLQYQLQHQVKYHDPAARRQLALQRSSSSEFDENDGDRSRGAATPANDRQHQVVHGPSTSASQMTPDVAAFFDRRRRPNFVRDDDSSSRRDGEGDDDPNEAYEFHTFESAKDDDDDDFDDVDDDASRGSMSYSRRREMEARIEKEKERQRAAAEAKSSELNESNPFTHFGKNNPFVKNEQVDEFRKKYDTPTNRAAAGVAVASTVGFLVLGPVGLLVGAATVGIGAGVMQIPEEQRSNMYVKASEAAHGAHEAAIACTESLSNSCANTYENSVADHVPAEMKNCCTAIDEEVTKVVASSKGVVDSERFTSDAAGNDTSKHAELQGSKSRDGKVNTSPNHRFRNKKNNVACLREGSIIPVTQIHALDPSAQPRAWLDVLASAETHHEEKVEAMEEILILAKDKQRARVFLEEGILDSIMWTLGRYMEKVEYNKAPSGAWQFPSISSQEAASAKLAAACCLTLGKSHCAAIHTGGDLLLMSMYERGTVPEERQLAQMLHEVAFHARATKVDDPTIVDPRNEVFAMKQLSLTQAEELAQKIKAVADGKL